MTFARVRALVVVSALAVLAVAFVVYALVDDSQKGRTLAAQCPEGWPVVDLTLKKSEDIKINVFNATDKVGIADSVGSDFANRKFQVIKKGNSKTAVDGVALLRYGPKAVAGAHVIRAYFLDEAKTEYDPARKDDVVDVVIGDQFKQLATSTEVNQSLVELAAGGEPKLPPQSCPAP
ncbi:LytR C-terminal domain-containing protein [Asanoa iriomotensis]|uniref:LytR C-terminal domain-containing protein n=1 Tax=Asanoa iriomotensis TaxID=234613 RepID=UPI001940A1A0|nr:LytR C-terminal domain-containing protein [Asanoa iriomotensis]